MADPIREAIRDRALSAGFDAVGFAEASLGAEARAGIGEFIARGYHGDMGWLASTAQRRGDPRALWPEARSVVVLGMSYAPDEDPLAITRRSERGAVSVYARGRDYHDIVKRRLKALARFIAARWPGELKVFVDTAPVMEKPLAEQAGIGWQGKHTNLVSRQFGSWLFLGEILLSVELPADAPETDHCGHCRACLDICPTKAFPAPYRLDARRCISYLTIEHPGSIPEPLREAIGNRVYGCDDCQLACPWNKYAQRAQLPDFDVRNGLDSATLVELFGWSEDEFRQRHAGSSILRIGYLRWLRNLAVALGNAPAAPEVLMALRARADHPSELVREHVAWALQRQRRQESPLSRNAGEGRG